jgi:hypothetical protein
MLLAAALPALRTSATPPAPVCHSALENVQHLDHAWLAIQQEVRVDLALPVPLQHGVLAAPLLICQLLETGAAHLDGHGLVAVAG